MMFGAFLVIGECMLSCEVGDCSVTALTECQSGSTKGREFPLSVEGKGRFFFQNVVFTSTFTFVVYVVEYPYVIGVEVAFSPPPLSEFLI